MTLTEQSTSWDEKQTGYQNLQNQGMPDFAKMAAEMDPMLKLFDGWDSYNATGDMIDHFVSKFPPLKEAWEKMSVVEKWLFVEFIFYGIHSGVRQAQLET